MTREREVLRELVELPDSPGSEEWVFAVLDVIEHAKTVLAEPAPEAEVREEWGLVWPDLEGPFAGGVSTGYAEDTARAIAKRENRTLVRRTTYRTLWSVVPTADTAEEEKS